MAKLTFVPEPKRVKYAGTDFQIPAAGWIVLEPSETVNDFYAAERLAESLEIFTESSWKVSRHIGPVREGEEIQCIYDETVEHEQGYRIRVSTKGVELRARTAAGMFYAMQTLTQLARQMGRRGKRTKVWPGMIVEDYPDFDRRGVYHDVSRGKVPQLGTILQLVDDLAALKINEFQLYVENVFEFRRHPEMHDDTTPMTAEELLIIDEACRQKHIDFVPSLTSLGHFEKILNRPTFRKLAEAEPADLRKRGLECWSDQPWSLCVTDPKAQLLLKNMYDEFLPNFTSAQFNICCDESYDLGKGRSQKLAEKIGVGQMYVNWIKYCAKLAAQHGRHIQMWGDIIRHYPDLIDQLPKDATLLEWGYEANHAFDERVPPFKKAGLRFYVAPGTSTWLTLSGRTVNAFQSMRAAARAGLKHQAAGFLNTDWGDNGHQQLLSISLLPFAFGAAVAWNEGGVADDPKAVLPPPPKNLDESARATYGFPLSAYSKFLRAASLHVFGDATGKFATLAAELGMSYTRFGWQRFNASVDWFLFREKWDFANYVNRVKAADLEKVKTATEKLVREFESLLLDHPDGDLIRDEFIFTGKEIIHTAERTLARQKWIAANPAKRNPEHELGKLPAAALNKKQFGATLKKLSAQAMELSEIFQSLWLARNKESRLQDVVAEFDRLQKEYKTYSK